MICRKHIVNINNQNEVNRVVYLWLSSQKYSKFKISSGIAIINELMEIGQINNFYKNAHNAVLFSIFINYCLGCPMENILNTGSCNISPLSLFRLFGNGAFEIILKELKELKEE